MVRRSGLLALLFLFPVSVSEASMNGQSIPGTIHDNRVTRCGIRIEGEGMAILRPFIEASSDVSGEFRIRLSKRSKSGSSTISQSGRFSGGRLGEISLAVDRPASAALVVSVTDGAGRTLCEIDTTVELDAAGNRI